MSSDVEVVVRGLRRGVVARLALAANFVVRKRHEVGDEPGQSQRLLRVVLRVGVGSGNERRHVVPVLAGRGCRGVTRCRGCHRLGLAIGIVEARSTSIDVARFGSPDSPAKLVIDGLAFGEDFSRGK